MRGIIAWMVRNGVAANLLMLFLVFSGLVSLLSVKQMVFPEFSLDVIEVRVDYPGALPSEIEDSIIKRIEDQIEGVDGIREVRAQAAEGVGVVTLELNRGEDTATKLDEIKAEIDRITAFPGEAEEPQVSELTTRSRVVEIALYGDVPPRALKELAELAKDDLSLDPAISFVDVRGTQPYEISIEISNDRLRAYGLSLTQVAAIIAENSLDLPAGEIETGRDEILVRTVGRSYTGQDFGDIVLIGDAGGATVHLRDVATVVDGFQETDSFIEFNGQPAAFVQVFRIGEERVLDVVAAVETYVDETLRAELPPGVSLRIWRNDANELEDRLSLLIRNGIIGLTLVMIALTLFLDLKLAFWVAAGIFVSFIGAFTAMGALGISINQLSLFGFILAIGIVVDDAIVVGENIFARNHSGVGAREAAIAGATRISTPVIFAVLTTIVAFIPLLFLPGTLGKFLGDVPAVVIIVLVLSLVESLLVLPRHLSHVDPARPRRGISVLLARAREATDRALTAFTSGPLDGAVRFATLHWGFVIACSIAIFFLALGLLSSGLVKFGFAPRVEATYVTASLELAPGANAERTERIAEQVRQIGLEAANAIEADLGLEKGSTIIAQYLSIGAGTGFGSGPGGGGISLPQANEATIILELIDPNEREFRTQVFENRWRAMVPELPDVTKLVFSSSLINIGDPVDLEISGANAENLDRAVRQIEQELNGLNGVFDVRSDQEQGRREVTLSLKPEARTFGLTLQDVAAQIRAAFFGAEALRVQRNREEVRVYVRLPEVERRTIGDIYTYRIRTPQGDFVPLRSVVDIAIEEGPTTINRRNGQRIVTITANVDESVTTGADVNAYMIENYLPRLFDRIPDVTFALAGEQREQAETGAVLGRSFLIALFVIYTLLAVVFRSYTQPLIVLAAIPFGLVGAIVGHLIMGITMTFISVFGVVGLSGVIINGSLVLIDFFNDRRREVACVREAIVDAAKARFRPILLTSLTTFLGIFPLIIEQSTQAQFLVPLAVSIGFGVLVGVPIAMFLVPALCMAHARIMGTRLPE